MDGYLALQSLELRESTVEEMLLHHKLIDHMKQNRSCRSKQKMLGIQLCAFCAMADLCYAKKR